MAQLKIRHVLLAFLVAAAGLDQHQVHSLAVSHHRASAVSVTDSVNILTQPISTKDQDKSVRLDDTEVITSADPTKALELHTTGADADEADAVRTAVNFPGRISDILDTVVMASLGLASIVVAVILGRKTLRAMRIQLQVMLNAVHRRPSVSDVELHDLENGQTNPSGSRIEVRSEISSVSPAQRADRSNDLIPESQPHVVGDDLLAQPVKNHEQASNQPRQLPSEHDSPHYGATQHEDRGQPPEDSPTASNCSQSGRQDSKSLNLNDLRHLDDRELKFPIHSGMGKSLTLSYQA